MSENNKPSFEQLYQTAINNHPITKYINAKSLFNQKEYVSHIKTQVALYKNSNGNMVLNLLPLDINDLPTVKAFLEMAQDLNLKVVTTVSKPHYELLESHFIGEGKNFNVKNLLASYRKIKNALIALAFYEDKTLKENLQGVKENLEKSLRELGFKGEL